MYVLVIPFSFQRAIVCASLEARYEFYHAEVQIVNRQFYFLLRGASDLAFPFRKLE